MDQGNNAMPHENRSLICDRQPGWYENHFVGRMM